MSSAAEPVEINGIAVTLPFVVILTVEIAPAICLLKRPLILFLSIFKLYSDETCSILLYNVPASSVSLTYCNCPKPI